MAKRVSVAEAKRRFSDVVGAVRHGGQRFALVGAFRDAKDLPNILDEVVKTRAAQRRRPAPKLGG